MGREFTSRTFIPLFPEPWNAASLERLLSSLGVSAGLPTRCVRPPLTGLAFLTATGQIGALIDEWWRATVPSDSLPVLLMLHDPELPAWIGELEAAFVIGLLHVAGGSARATEIATKVDGIDVAVLGHASADGATREPLVVGRTRVVYAGADGSRIGRIDLRSSDAGAPRVEDTTLAVDGSIPPHPGVGLFSEVEVAKVRIAEEKAAAAERRKKG